MPGANASTFATVEDGCAKLTADQVAEIRAIGSSMKQRDIAAQYGVSQKTIWRVLSGKGWAA